MATVTYLTCREYADGRVVWNIVDALRSQNDHGSSVTEQSRESMISIRSQSSNYTGSRRGSRIDDPAQPWHVGPTAGLSFIRRPETRVRTRFVAGLTTDVLHILSRCC